jgi:hypothetical protein
MVFIVHAMQSMCLSIKYLVPRASNKTFTDYAITNKLTPFISMQNHYSLMYREEEREMMPTLKVRVCFFCLRHAHDECLPKKNSISVWALSHGLLWAVVF